MTELTPSIARQIIERVGGPGEPPDYGFQFFTAGLDAYLSVIDEDYLSSFVKDGGAAFKMVVGVYGGGKTHFLYSVRDLAWKNHFVVSYVSLSPGESPFHRLDLVYSAIVRGLIPPLSPEELLSGYEHGIASLLRTWYSEKSEEYRNRGLTGDSLREELLSDVERLDGLESISFAHAVRSAFRMLVDRRDGDLSSICQWLLAEGYDRRVHSRHGILQRIDRTTAFTMVRSLCQWVRKIGYSGLVILLDEAERVPSLSTKQRELHLNNLREIIDECGHTTFQSIMIFYAVPDENFLEGRTQVYEALKQRVATVFEDLNPSGVKIELERVAGEPISLLTEIGEKLARIYQIAYEGPLEPSGVRETIKTTADYAYGKRFGDIGYKRLFVQKLVKGLHYLRKLGAPPTSLDLDH